jgi:hypothetical protein
MKKLRHRKGHERARREEYPPVEEFLDAYYWQQRGNPKPMERWLERIDTIKQRYPKDKSDAN